MYEAAISYMFPKFPYTFSHVSPIVSLVSLRYFKYFPFFFLLFPILGLTLIKYKFILSNQSLFYASVTKKDIIEKVCSVFALESAWQLKGLFIIGINFIVVIVIKILCIF